MSFTPKIAALIDAHGDGWNVEGADVESDFNDAIAVCTQAGPIPNAYVKNPDTLVQLNNAVAACVSAKAACDFVMTDMGFPSAEFANFDRKTFTNLDCEMARMCERWFGKADGMQYTVLHMTHVTGEGGGPNLPTQVFILGGNNFLDRAGAQARVWFDRWWNQWAAYVYPASANGGVAGFHANLLGYPILGGTAGSTGTGSAGLPAVPFFGVLLNCQFGLSALYDDIRGITGLMGPYLSSASRAKMNLIQSTYQPAAAAALSQAMIDEGYINPDKSSKKLEDSYVTTTVNSAWNAAGRIAYRWYNKALEFNTDYLQVMYDSTLPWIPPVSNVTIYAPVWPSVLDHARSFAHWLFKRTQTTQNDPYPPPYTVFDSWSECVGCNVPGPTPPPTITNPCGQPSGTSRTITASATVV